MTRRPFHRIIPWLVLAVAAGLAVLLAACDEGTYCPGYAVGAVEGYVTSVGEGFAVKVEAEAVGGEFDGRRIMTTESDSTGWYRMDLPSGFYRIRTDLDDGYLPDSDPRDTVTVETGIRRIDLQRGRAVMTAVMPAFYEGKSFGVTFDGIEPGYAIESEVVIDGRLSYTAPLLMPGSYRIRLHNWSLDVEIWMPGVSVMSDGDIIEVTTESVVEYGIDFTESFASISGAVTGSWLETNLSRPKVHIHAMDYRELGNARCDEDGLYMCPLFMPQPVRLRVRLDGRDNWIGGESFETATVFDVQPGDSLTDVDLVESGIHVQVLESGGLEFDTAIIELYDQDLDQVHWVPASTDSRLICNLDPGRYYLYLNGSCTDQAWAAHWYGGTSDPATATPIDLASGVLDSLELDLAPGARIFGTVTDAEGAPVPLIDAGLYLGADMPLCTGYAQFRYFETGAFEFTGLGEGEYYAGLIHRGVIWWYPGTATFAAAWPVFVEDGAATEIVDWRLPPSEEKSAP